MLLIRGFTNLHFGGAVVMDSPSKAVAMTQTEHSTVGGTSMVTPKGGNYTSCPFPPFYLEKKKKPEMIVEGERGYGTFKGTGVGLNH
jgi:hypothetical protein